MYAKNDINSIKRHPTISQDALHRKPDIHNEIVKQSPNPITPDSPIKSKAERQGKTNQPKILILSQRP